MFYLTHLWLIHTELSFHTHTEEQNNCYQCYFNNKTLVLQCGWCKKQQPTI